jgi:hypothetical protein
MMQRKRASQRLALCCFCTSECLANKEPLLRSELLVCVVFSVVEFTWGQETTRVRQAPC